MPETLTRKKLSAVNADLSLDDAALRGPLADRAGLRMTRRDPTPAEIAATAVFVASDHAGGVTGIFVDVTGVMFPG